MKFSTIFLAGLVSANEKKVPPSYPMVTLDRLVQFSAEILDSGAFNKSKNGPIDGKISLITMQTE